MDVMPRVEVGDPISAEFLNWLRDLCLANRVSLDPSSGLTGHRGPNGIAIGFTNIKPIPTGNKIIAITGGAGIPAASGATPGSGPVVLYSIAGAGTAAVAGATVTAFHWMTKSAVAGGAHVVLEVDQAGNYVVVAEDCS